MMPEPITLMDQLAEEFDGQSRRNADKESSIYNDGT